MNKQILNLIYIPLLLLVFASCKKEETKIYYEGGSAPVLTASSNGPFVLVKDNNMIKVLTLNWTNPEYQFNTGVSSQNVTYVLQVDSAGKNFSSSKLQEMAITSNLGVTLTARELNSFLSRMEFKAGQVHAVDMRIKSTLTAGSVPQYSNPVTVKVNPYLDFAVEPPGTPANNYEDGELWIVGDAVKSGWDVNLVGYETVQKFERDGDVLHYKAEINFLGGGGYKLIQTLGVWGTQYHALDGSAAAALEGSFQKKDSDPQFPGPPAGRYLVKVNFQTGKYSLTKL